MTYPSYWPTPLLPLTKSCERYAGNVASLVVSLDRLETYLTDHYNGASTILRAKTQEKREWGRLAASQREHDCRCKCKANSHRVSPTTDGTKAPVGTRVANANGAANGIVPT